jgi:copper oxidase (laccase) domain-containing protein
MIKYTFLFLALVELSTSTCPAKRQYTETINVVPNALTALVGVKGTNYTFSRSLNPTQFALSVNQLVAQNDQFIGPYQNLIIPISLLNGKIVVTNNISVLLNTTSADIICTNQCVSLGFVTSDALVFTLSDGTFICSGTIGLTNCQTAPQLINAIKSNYPNVNLANVNIYMGPSARSPYYYVGANVYQTYTQDQQTKYFVQINSNDTDANGDYIMNTKDRLSGTPRYGFDFSVLFKDGLIDQGIPSRNIVQDNRNTMFSSVFTSARATSNSFYTQNPQSTQSTSSITNLVGRNLIFNMF